MKTFHQFLSEQEALGAIASPTQGAGKQIVVQDPWFGGTRVVGIAALCRSPLAYKGKKLLRWVVPPLGGEEKIKPPGSFETWSSYVRRICSG